MEVWLNGRIMPQEAAAISLWDRGFQFSEGIYEVIAVYRGHLVDMDRHMRRLLNSGEAVGIEVAPMVDDLTKGALELLRRSGLQDAAIYIQITTGAGTARTHLRPSNQDLTALVTLWPTPQVPDRWRQEGIRAITVHDDRWARCYVKTTMLMPNTIARKRAAEAGCEDAIFIRDGMLTEATASNVFAVFDGVLSTPAKSNYILHGITREAVLELAEKLGIPRYEGPIPAEKLYTAGELFTTGSTAWLVPVTTLDGRTIGTGRPGPIYTRLQEAYERRARGE